MLKPVNDRLEPIWAALDEGRILEAFELVQQLQPTDDDVDARLVVAIVYLEAGRPRGAYDSLKKLEGQHLDGDAEFARRFHLAQAAYSLGEPQEALDLLYTLEPASREEQANILWWRGLSYDHLGRGARADRCFAEAQELDPDGAPVPLSITPDETEAVVARVAEQLPPPLQAAFEEVPVVIQDLPSLELIKGSGGEVHPDTLGLYTGAHLQERSYLWSDGLPATIYLYRRNLERFARSREELEREIGTTLLHELGHHLGYDEDDLERMGLA